MTKLELLEKLNKERTQGEWCQEPLGEYDSRTLYADNGAPDYENWPIISEDVPREVDAEFISAAANSMDALLAVARVANKTINRLKVIRKERPLVAGVVMGFMDGMKAALAELEKQ